MKPFYRIARSTVGLGARLLLRYGVVHRERIIEDGPAILACNHESFLDPPLVAVACRREIHFLARRSLLADPFLRIVLPRLNVIPIDPETRDRLAIKTVIRLLGEGERILIFPEGARTLDGLLQPAQPGIGLIAAKTRAPVVPLRIFGARRALPRGSARLRLSRVHLVVGTAIPPAAEGQASGRDAYRRIGERIMHAIAALRPDGEASPATTTFPVAGAD